MPDAIFGLVVDDKEAARRALHAAGVVPIDGQFLDFRDPWGNRIEIVGYDNIQFTKAPNVLKGMGLSQSCWRVTALSGADRAGGGLVGQGGAAFAGALGPDRGH